MALKKMPVGFDDQDERPLLDILAEILTEELGEAMEPTSAIRFSIREALDKRKTQLDQRGVSVSERAFLRKKEGRPKPDAQGMLNPLSIGYTA